MITPQQRCKVSVYHLRYVEGTPTQKEFIKAFCLVIQSDVDLKYVHDWISWTMKKAFGELRMDRLYLTENMSADELYEIFGDELAEVFS